MDYMDYSYCKVDERGMRASFAGVIVAVASLLVTLAAGASDVSGTQLPAEPSNSLMRDLPKVGQVLGTIEVEQADGTMLPLDDPGKIYLIDFWVIGCKPCKKEMPGLIKLQEALASEGANFELVSLLGAVSLPEGEYRREALAELHRRMHFPRGLPVYTDPQDLSGRFGVRGYPTKIIVQDSKVLWRSAGAYKGSIEDLEVVLRRFMEPRR